MNEKVRISLNNGEPGEREREVIISFGKATSERLREDLEELKNDYYLKNGEQATILYTSEENLRTIAEEAGIPLWKTTMTMTEERRAIVKIGEYAGMKICVVKATEPVWEVR